MLSPIHTRMPTGVAIVKVLFRQSSCSDLMDVASLPGLEDPAFQQTSWSSGSYSLSTLSSVMFSNFVYRNCVVNTSVGDGHPVVSCSLHFDQAVDACNGLHLLQMKLV